MSVETALGADLKKIHSAQKNSDFKHGYPSHHRYTKNWKDYYKFTVVRNPWARLVSSYFFDLHHAKKCLVRPSEFRNKKAKLKWEQKNMRLGERRRLVFQYGVDGFADCMKKYLSLWYKSNLIYRPQAKWLRPGQPNQSLSAYDRICLLENIDNDFKYVCDDLGITASLPRINTTAHEPYRYYYDTALVDLVGTVYKKDVARFSYEF